MLPLPALAIPSPDLVVNAFTNLAQLFGLLTATAGGVAVFRHRGLVRAKKPGAAAATPGFRRLWILAGALLAVSIGANVLQWVHQSDARNERLQRNLVRASSEQGRIINDVELRTLRFSAQIDHPLGISTGQLAELLADARRQGFDGINLIDVREPEEIETGRLPGFETRRFPDLLASPEEPDLRGKQNVLLCHSGNRSSEACDKLAALGIPCKFVIGGFEKWRAEERPVAYPIDGPPDELRAVAAYPNADTLLDTPDAERLVAEDNVLFVDVRYPHEFNKTHLPGAINIPVRRLTSDVLLGRLRALPDRPIVAPCYDKRSCFYSKILGLRLHRLGYDFRGRYTVPHEYYASPAPDRQKTYVNAWRAAHEGAIVAPAIGVLEQWLRSIDKALGSIGWAVIVLAIAFRASVAPLSIKAERDRIVQLQLAPEIEALRARLKEQPQRLARALRSLYRRNRINPLVNLLGIGIQIPLFLLFLPAVDAAVGDSNQPFLWLQTLSGPDRLLVLPILIAGLSIELLRSSWARGPRVMTRRFAIALAAGALGLLCVHLSAGVNLYLVASLAMMLLQARLVDWFLGRRRNFPAVSAAFLPAADAAVSLSEAHNHAGLGNKAARLGRLIEAGFCVPGGVAVPCARIVRKENGIVLDPEDRRRIEQACQLSKSPALAVRSSGQDEDGSFRSFAGVYASLLDVTPDFLEDAIATVHDSLVNDRPTVYSDAPSGGGAVIVQEMVNAEFAGVLFTEHPGESGSVLVELSAGTGDGVVGGTTNSQAYRFGRLTGEPLDDEAAPVDLSPLLALGRRAEALFGRPQDLEWAYANGTFHVLQSRDITALSRERSMQELPGALFERERHRLIEIALDARPDEAVLEQTELSELLPQPTPMSLSVMQRLWEPGGSRSLSCEILGIPYEVDEEEPPIVTTAFGNLYVNRRLMAQSGGKGPGIVASFRLSRSAETLEHEFREHFLPDFEAQVRQREALDLSRFTNGELIEFFSKSCDQFVQETYVQADVINLAAGFYLTIAERQLRNRGLPAARYLARVPETIVNRALSTLPDIRAGRTPRDRFLELFGHRAVYDYELALPRYAETPSLVDELAAKSAPRPERDASPEKNPALPLGSSLAVAVHRARKFQALKEEAKHHCLREFALLRRILLEIDARFHLGGGVFYLRADEVPELADLGQWRALLSRIAERQQRDLYFKALPSSPPVTITPRDLETLTPERRTVTAATDGLRGTLVAGSPTAGIARVLRHPQELELLQDGEILVVPFLSPEWSAALPRVHGLVSELGGWLSHLAILSRELNVSTMVGVRNACSAIPNGAFVRLHADGSVEVSEAPSSDSSAPTAPCETGDAPIRLVSGAASRF